MSNSIAIIRKKAVSKSVITVAAIASAIVLPQIFHILGLASGTGTAVGAAFLPMHIPVLLAGLLGGPYAGIIAGLLSPVISFYITGMPTAAMLPFIVVELGVYGLTAGLLSQKKMNTFLKLIITQIAGRAARMVAVIAAIYVFGNTQLTMASIGTVITAGIFGIILQWSFIPLFTDRIKNVKKLYE